MCTHVETGKATGAALMSEAWPAAYRLLEAAHWPRSQRAPTVKGP